MDRLNRGCVEARAQDLPGWWAEPGVEAVRRLRWQRWAAENL
jgi:hypothetical protein